MTDTHNHDSGPANLGRTTARLTFLLTAAALFALGLAIKTGYTMVDRLEPEQAEAAVVATIAPANAAATQIPTETVVPTATQTEPTAVPPTWTPLPTATPQPTPLPPTPTPVIPRLVTNENNINIRRGPGTGYEVIGKLESGAEARITGRYGDWWQIELEGMPADVPAGTPADSNADTPESAPGYVFREFATAFDVGEIPEMSVQDLPGPTLTNPLFEPAPTWAINEERWIDVDLSKQRVTAYEGQRVVQSYLVSTGLPGTPTPEGQFRIWIKFRYDDMEGDDYFLADVPWVMYLYRGSQTSRPTDVLC